MFWEVPHEKERTPCGSQPTEQGGQFISQGMFGQRSFVNPMFTTSLSRLPAFQLSLVLR